MAKFVPIEEVVELACLASGDTLQRNKGKFLAYSKQIWLTEMNLSTTKIAVRKLMDIDRTNNTIILPADSLKLSSVSVIGPDGTIYPLFRNDKLHDDLVDVAAKSNASCTCDNQLCNMIKGYEAITEVLTEPMPDGSVKDFTCITRKGFLGDTFYEERQYPIQVMTSGVWTDTQIKTEKFELCKVDTETDENGHTHIRDCEENLQLITQYINCSPSRDEEGLPIGGDNEIFKSYNEWIFHQSVSMSDGFDKLSSQCSINYSIGNIYNISELGDRIIFPPEFGHRQALVRYFADVNLNKLRIPYLAVPTFIDGILWYNTRWNEKTQALAINFEKVFSRHLWGLGAELSKLTQQELAKAFVSHYIYPTHHTERGNHAR